MKFPDDIGFRLEEEKKDFGADPLQFIDTARKSSTLAESSLSECFLIFDYVPFKISKNSTKQVWWAN